MFLVPFRFVCWISRMSPWLKPVLQSAQRGSFVLLLYQDSREGVYTHMWTGRQAGTELQNFWLSVVWKCCTFGHSLSQAIQMTDHQHCCCSKVFCTNICWAMFKQLQLHEQTGHTSLLCVEPSRKVNAQSNDHRRQSAKNAVPSSDSCPLKLKWSTPSV